MKQLAYFVIFLAFNTFFGSSILGSQDLGLATTQAPLPCVDRTFTIVAHIVRDTFGEPNVTEQEIMMAVDSMNNAFAPICINFEICAFRDIPNFQYDNIEDEDELNEMFAYYNEEKRINMYFISSSYEPFCGKTTIGGIATEPEMNPGIAIIKGDCMVEGFKTVTHEMGHFFDLLDTFEDAGTPDAELVDGSNCTTNGDLVCDTPADPYIQGNPASDYVDEELCRFTLPIRDANNDWFVPDVGNMMSFYQASCNCLFTHGQYTRMANTYLNSDRDNW